MIVRWFAGCASSNLLKKLVLGSCRQSLACVISKYECSSTVLGGLVISRSSLGKSTGLKNADLWKKGNAESWRLNGKHMHVEPKRRGNDYFGRRCAVRYLSNPPWSMERKLKLPPWSKETYIKWQPRCTESRVKHTQVNGRLFYFHAPVSIQKK